MIEDRYIISDASKILEIEPHVLRYWEEELELDIERNKLGHRYYKESDFELLRKIKLLKEKGLQLRAIKLLLTTTDKDMSEKLLTKEETNNDLSVSNPPTSLSNNSPNPSETNNLKLKQFQEFIKNIIENSFQKNTVILKEELINEVSMEVRNIMRDKEALDEKRFRKLDQTIRERQKARLEVAATSNKRKFFKKK